MEKICSKCGIKKTLDKFHKLKTGVLGYHSNCKDCRKDYGKLMNYKKPISGKLKCLKCKEIKDINHFYRNSCLSTGAQSYCIICQKENIYESKNKLELFIKRCISKLKKHNLINFNLNDIIEIYNTQDKKCALSGELLTYYIGPKLTDNKYESKYNICIIKKKDELGWDKENIILIGNIVYKMKQNMNINDFLQICKIVSFNELYV